MTLNQKTIQLYPILTASEHPLYPQNGFQGECANRFINYFLFIVSPPTDRTAFRFIVLLVGIQTGHVKYMTTGQYKLRLNFEIFEADAAAILRIVSYLTFLLNN
jgi:hypothetical protein